jgi:predicted acyl esterase
MQRKFFDRYLKDSDNGWEREPKVQVAVRAADDTVERVVDDMQWPLSDTRWTRFYLDASGMALGAAVPGKSASAAYAALSEGLTFSTAPLERSLEFAGPIKAKLWVSSSTGDMDLFVTLRAFDPRGKEITALDRMATLARPRSDAKAGTRRSGRNGRRDLAGEPRASRRLSPRAHAAGQGLRTG